MVGPKGHKGKGRKRNEVDPNVGDFPIGAHGFFANRAYNLNISFSFK
jgi:hypothetical protein